MANLTGGGGEEKDLSQELSDRKRVVHRTSRIWVKSLRGFREEDRK